VTQRRDVSARHTGFDSALKAIEELVPRFMENEAYYLGNEYPELEARKDFIDKFFTALGWDVNHDLQVNPYEQEVKVERPVQTGRSQRRADYAFYRAPWRVRIPFKHPTG